METGDYSHDNVVKTIKSTLLCRFVVAAGAMPSHSTLYNATGEPVYQFGAAHRNTISWSPHGRFLCLAGFGNLAGEMDFYDILRLKKLGSWSYFMTC
jgi:translation initiation factor 2A